MNVKLCLFIGFDRYRDIPEEFFQERVKARQRRLRKCIRLWGFTSKGNVSRCSVPELFFLTHLVFIASDVSKDEIQIQGMRIK